MALLKAKNQTQIEAMQRGRDAFAKAEPKHINSSLGHLSFDYEKTSHQGYWFKMGWYEARSLSTTEKVDFLS